jgi:hypothetical protein
LAYRIPPALEPAKQLAWFFRVAAKAVESELELRAASGTRSGPVSFRALASSTEPSYCHRLNGSGKYRGVESQQVVYEGGELREDPPLATVTASTSRKQF